MLVYKQDYPVGEGQSPTKSTLPPPFCDEIKFDYLPLQTHKICVLAPPPHATENMYITRYHRGPLLGAWNAWLPLGKKAPFPKLIAKLIDLLCSLIQFIWLKSSTECWYLILRNVYTLGETAVQLHVLSCCFIPISSFGGAGDFYMSSNTLRHSLPRHQPTHAPWWERRAAHSGLLAARPLSTAWPRFHAQSAIFLDHHRSCQLCCCKLGCIFTHTDAVNWAQEHIPARNKVPIFCTPGKETADTEQQVRGVPGGV